MPNNSLLGRSTRPLLVAGILAFLLPVAWLSVLAGSRYAGNVLVFTAFALLSNALLLTGFRRGASFFDSYIGIFLWLGFFLKAAVRIAFFGGRFSESVGAFDGSGGAFDLALTVASAAFAALMIGSFLRQRILSYPGHTPDCSNSGLFLFYCAHRQLLLAAFLALLVLITVSNAWLGIYQRGMIAQTILPLGLNGVYKWLLQFGLASGSALIIRFEIMRSGALSTTAIFLPLLENFMCNVSLLSRGMILNGSALVLGGFRQLRSDSVRVGKMKVLVVIASFGFVFVASVFSVNFLRSQARLEEVASSQRVEMAADNAAYMSKTLFIDRWVGMESLMAVSAAKDLGWDLWRQAWREKYDDKALSLFDSRFISSPYKDMKLGERFHYVSLPGLIAFLFYTGSIPFVFTVSLAVAVLAGLMEMACYRWCGRNLVLCSLFAQVVAFRFSSFGYVPSQSFLLFGSLILNGVLIAGADYLLSRRTNLHGARAAGTS